jgi:hypothetical protein
MSARGHDLPLVAVRSGTERACLQLWGDCVVYGLTLNRNTTKLGLAAV